MAKLLALHGPNLNLLGTRETSIYGSTTLTDINNKLTDLSNQYGHEITCHQSNAESKLIDLIHTATNQNIACIIFNPAAYTHTSIALRDALLAVNIPFIEIHLSNIYARENFRNHSYFSDIAAGIISGFGPFGYELAITAANNIVKNLAK